MEKALKIAGLPAEKVDYINAHGTATLNNDLSEGRAIRRIFKDTIPAFSSTKAFTGHCLAAAGAVEAVFSLLALEQGKIFPNLNFEKTIPELDLQPVTRLEDRDLNYVLSNSFGFGGNCTSLIFSKDGL
jgi:3-oxoacyl-[acyl-carrier-protein] synthase-1